jgi:hypothetical protein
MGVTPFPPTPFRKEAQMGYSSNNKRIDESDPIFPFDYDMLDLLNLLFSGLYYVLVKCV